MCSFQGSDSYLISAILDTVLCDVSTKAYAVIVYLVTVSEDAEVTFVAAKSRVTPLQTQTIPHLELLSSLLLAHLITTVAERIYSTLPQLELKCFTDSQVTLYWIQGVQKEWKPFVQKEVKRKVSIEQWSHCPGETNPADLPSRGLSLLELSVSKQWCCGLEWLPAAYCPNMSQED